MKQIKLESLNMDFAELIKLVAKHTGVDVRVHEGGDVMDRLYYLIVWEDIEFVIERVFSTGDVMVGEKNFGFGISQSLNILRWFVNRNVPIDIKDDLGELKIIDKGLYNRLCLVTR